MPTRRLYHCLACLACLLLARPATAQDATAEADRLLGEIRVLRMFNSLRLAPAQLETVRRQLPLLAEQQARLTAADTQYANATRADLALARTALLNGTPLDTALSQRLQRAYDVWLAARQQALRETDRLLAVVEQTLTADQRRWIEPDEAFQARLQAQADQARLRSEAVESGLRDLTGWVREADQAAFVARRDERAAALAGLALPNATAAQRQAAAQRLMAVFERVRALPASRLTSDREQFGAWLDEALAPPAEAGFEPMSRSAWRELWLAADTHRLLAQWLRPREQM